MSKYIVLLKEQLQKYKLMPDALKAVLVYVAINFFSKGISFVTTPIFTRILSVEDYGIINIYSTWVSLIGVIATLSLTSGGLNIGMNEFKKERNEFLASLLILSNIATCVLGIIFYFGYDIIGNFIELPHSLFILMFIYFIFNPAKEFWLAKQRFEYKYKLASIMTVSFLMLATCVSIYVCITKDNDKAIWRIWTMEGIPLIVSVLLYFHLIIKGIKNVKFKYWKYIIPINLPLIIHILAKSLLDSSDKLMIGKIVGAEDVGKYSVISMISMIASILWTSINASFEPFTYQCLDKKKYKKVNSISMMLLIAYLFVCGGIILIGPEVVKLLAPEQYWDAIHVVPPMVGSIFFMALYNLFGNIELFYKRTGYIMCATLGATVLNIVLNGIFIPLYSYIAAAYTTLFCFIMLACAHYYNVERITGKTIYEKRKLILLGVGMLGIVLLGDLLYKNSSIRYGVILGVSVLMLSFRKKIVAQIAIIYRERKG